MSLAIDVDDVTEVLLAGTWYTVAEASFSLDAYEYVWYPSEDQRRPEIVHGGGSCGVCATGFEFKTTAGDLMAGPLTAITAVRYGEKTSKPIGNGRADR